MTQPEIETIVNFPIIYTTLVLIVIGLDWKNSAKAALLKERHLQSEKQEIGNKALVSEQYPLKLGYQVIFGIIIAIISMVFFNTQINSGNLPLDMFSAISIFYIPKEILYLWLCFIVISLIGGITFGIIEDFIMKKSHFTDSSPNSGYSAYILATLSGSIGIALGVCELGFIIVYEYIRLGTI